MESQLRNSILMRLPLEEREKVCGAAELVHMDPHDVLIEPNKEITVVDFPEIGLHSMLAVVDDAQIEIATVGYEGMIGIPLVLGENSSSGRVFCQVPGKSWRLSGDTFVHLLRECPHLESLCRRYVNFVFDQAGQNSACNRIHTMEERCAKWLLLTHDRQDADEFELTQEFLGQMLGVRRQTVNLAAGILQNAGFIAYSRGKIRVLNRSGLESVACECYETIRTSMKRFQQ